jgi:hypothetical protein
MKLRLQFNTIRLRLKRSEVAQFAEAGRVEETIILGEGEGETLHYALEATDAIHSPRAELNGGSILVRVPLAMAEQWAANDEIAIEGDQAAGGETRLHILIEKDFACIDGTDEQNVDTFPNPLAGTKC